MSALRAAHARLLASGAQTTEDRAERDAILVRLAAELGVTYKELAAELGLSVQAIGKIVSAGGVRRYRPRGSGADDTGEDT
jgi:DNA-directed RNA polymerase specialized sigma24 family protein